MRMGRTWERRLGGAITTTGGDIGGAEGGPAGEAGACGRWAAAAGPTGSGPVAGPSARSRSMILSAPRRRASCRTTTYGCSASRSATRIGASSGPAVA